MLSGATDGDVEITYSTSIEGTDSAQQADFTAQSSQKASITSSETTGMISIPITNDDEDENNETFTLTLSAISGAVFSGEASNVVIKITIVDDEGLPTFTVDSSLQYK